MTLKFDEVTVKTIYGPSTDKKQSVTLNRHKNNNNKQNKNKTKINSKPRQNRKTATIKTMMRFFDSESVIVNRILTTFALNMSGYLVSA